MITVGIIANPASGKDIRRLVAHGSVFDNEEKVNIVRRALCGLAAVGVGRVLMMPESYGIGQRALHGLKQAPEVADLPLRPTFSQDDSRRAAALMAEFGVGCIITLGGDGTNRVVARGCGDVPLMPISTGTNNVFPRMIEGTIAGIAAGLVACNLAPDAARRTPCVEVLLDPQSEQAGDLALIDAVVYAERFIGARAVWETERLRELVLTRAEPGTIGLSSIGGHLAGGSVPPGHGLFVRAGAGGRSVLAPIAPGLLEQVPILEQRLLAPGEVVAIQHDSPCVLALDGEREHTLRPGAQLRLRISPDGPRVVQPEMAISLAVEQGFFLGGG